jgi:hypothetical protein
MRRGHVEVFLGHAAPAGDDVFELAIVERPGQLDVQPGFMPSRA